MKAFAPENVFESVSRVEDAIVPDDVSIQTLPFDDVFRVPTVVVASVRNCVFRFVVLAVSNDPYVVDEKLNRVNDEK